MRVALVILSVGVLAVAAPAWATFPGRNGQLAFSAYTLNDESSDILVDRELVGIARLPEAPRVFGVGSSPAFSPSGKTIAYAAPYGGRAPGIWLARPDCRRRAHGPAAPPCSRLRRLTRGGSDDSPVWSPDGRRVAFVRGSGRVYTVRARGGGRRLLVGGSDPDWSSTGELAFVAGGAGSGRAPIRVREPGGRIRRLGVLGSGPSWAPRGDRLAFSGYDRTTQERALYVINADGTGLRKIWDGDERVPLAPTWSPDGRRIVFIDDFQDGYTGWVYGIRPDGGRRDVLIRVPGELNFDDLSWQSLR